MLLRKIGMLHISSFFYPHISLLLNTLVLNLFQRLYKIIVCLFIEILRLKPSLILIIILYITLLPFSHSITLIIYILVLILLLSLSYIMIYYLPRLFLDNKCRGVKTFSLLSESNYYLNCVAPILLDILLRLVMMLLIQLFYTVFHVCSSLLFINLSRVLLLLYLTSQFTSTSIAS